MSLTFAGLWMYNRAKTDMDKGERKRASVEKRHHLVLPTTTNDVHRLSASSAGGLSGLTPDLSPSLTPQPGSGIRSEYMTGPYQPQQQAVPAYSHGLQMAYGPPAAQHPLHKSVDAIPPWIGDTLNREDNRQRASFSSGSTTPPVLVAAR